MMDDMAVEKRRIKEGGTSAFICRLIFRFKLA